VEVLESSLSSNLVASKSNKDNFFEQGCPSVPDGVHDFVLGKTQFVVSSIGILELFENILQLPHCLLPSACVRAFSAADS
jgi:hypothetical protein